MSTTTTTLDTIIQAVRESLSRRDSRRDVLAAKIREMTEAALEAARRCALELSEVGRLEYRALRADCSQWSNQLDYPAHTGDPVLVLAISAEIRALGPVPDQGFWDGSNLQSQRGEVRDDDLGTIVRPATVAQLRAVAAALPAALAALLSERQAEAESQATEADVAAALLD